MLKMEGIQTLKGSWPWPWPSIRPYHIPSCITHRPLPIYQISFKLKKLFVDGRTYGRTDGRTDISPLYIIRSTLGSRPKKHWFAYRASAIPSTRWQVVSQEQIVLDQWHQFLVRHEHLDLMTYVLNFLLKPSHRRHNKLLISTSKSDFCSSPKLYLKIFGGSRPSCA